MGYRVVYSDELYHYGVKGMKWGVRKAANRLSKRIRKAARKKQNEYLAKRRLRKQSKERIKDLKMRSKYRHKLSDRELDDLVKRLEKEKKVKDLSDSELKPGRKFAKDILSSTSKKVAVTALSGALIYLGKHFVENRFRRDNYTDTINWKELADSIWRGGAKKK